MLCVYAVQKHIMFHILYIIAAPQCHYYASMLLYNITMSEFMIRETTNKHYSTQLKTHVWLVSVKYFKYENILTGCESEVPDCPCKAVIAPLYRNSLCTQL